MASSSHNFIAAIEPHRDALYSRALAFAQTPAAAESLLLAQARKVFATSLTAEATDPVAAIGAELPAAAATAAMPADTWARLAAAVQVEASRSSAGALNPDHVLLKPDPLLAPKKHKRLALHTGIAPAYRFILAAGITVLLAASLTIFILHHRGGPKADKSAPPSTPSTPASQPAPATAPAIAPATAPATRTQG